ncbi:hypothetical protein LL033_23480 [Clostridium estertheticum]|uniref:hypothetical protein n=1 Tax=Clostridium estertheticum TaxID=238834 RepID=UPI001C0D0729|nr:hypothetical protein [Clostridium estertheticum]MBU3174698.1 hypothetical protein [Clostridium estertheticum]MBU3218387.1 hypothetical protein [Clostridium estertheticum]WAG55510.1 hypothetical protein LL033_23480 [Clostridium estertheticum]
MKIWNEYEVNVFNYFEYFNDEVDRRSNSILPDMSVISINASGMWGKDDKLKFINLSSRQINSLFGTNNLLEDYKFYIVVSKKIKDINSKVEFYKKIWKDIRKKWGIENFNLGVEIKVEAEGVSFFTSIAEFSIDNLSLALEIVSANPKLNTIIISKANDILTEKYTEKLFHTLFNSEAQDSKEIDYYSFCAQCCNEGDIAVRWGTSFEDAEVAMIYNPKKLSIQI